MLLLYPIGEGLGRHQAEPLLWEAANSPGTEGWRASAPNEAAARARKGLSAVGHLARALSTEN